jgi:hypothetical protein
VYRIEDTLYAASERRAKEKCFLHLRLSIVNSSARQEAFCRNAGSAGMVSGLSRTEGRRRRRLRLVGAG